MTIPPNHIVIITGKYPWIKMTNLIDELTPITLSTRSFTKETLNRQMHFQSLGPLNQTTQTKLIDQNILHPNLLSDSLAIMVPSQSRVQKSALLRNVPRKLQILPLSYLLLAPTPHPVGLHAQPISLTETFVGVSPIPTSFVVTMAFQTLGTAILK